MSHTPVHPVVVVDQALLQRCVELGAAAWVVDWRGEIVDGPAAPEAMLPLAQSGLMRSIVSAAAAERLSNGTAKAVEVFEGAWLVPIFEVRGMRRTGATVALFLTEAAPNSHMFSTLCRAANVDGKSVTAALLSSVAEVDRLAVTLRWSRDDLARARKDRSTLDQFSDKLSLAYEDTSMLFRLARLLNSAKQPAQLIQIVCDQLHQIMPFAWLAIQFHAANTRVPELAGRLMSSGEFAAGKAVLEREAQALLDQGSAEKVSRVLNPHVDPLAKIAGSEVLAEPIMHESRLVGMILAGNKRGGDPDVSSEETQFVSAAANFLGIFHESSARMAEQKALFLGILQALTASIDAKDPYTCGHSERVALLASQLASQLGLDRKIVEQYRIAGLVHDVGKIGIPEGILMKPGRLSEEEFQQVKRHPEIGHGILKDIPQMLDMLPGVLHHHERWDGKGYPHRLSGNDIPLIARVLALSDTFDAMSSTRAYRPALSREQVLAEIRRCSGAQFDAELVPVFTALDFAEFDRLLAKNRTAASFAA